MEMHEVIRQRRSELGMSQGDLAAKVGVDRRQIRRYESGEQQPLLKIAVAIADALKISVAELAGMPSHRVNLSGDWWASWQTFKDGQEVITAQEVRLRQEAEFIQVETTTRGIAVEDGGYHWRGDRCVQRSAHHGDDAHRDGRAALHQRAHAPEFRGSRADGRSRDQLLQRDLTVSEP